MRAIGTFLAISLTILGLAPQARASIDELSQFFEQSLVGRTLVNKSSGLSNNGQVAYDYELRKSFSAFMRTDRAFQVVVTSVVTQTNYDVVDGVRVLPGQNVDRVLTHVWAARKFDSIPNAIFGYSRTNSSTYSNPLGHATKLRFAMDGDRLIVEEESLHPGDCFGPSGAYVPCAFHNTETYYVENGKVRNDIEARTYAVDPQTLERGAMTSNGSWSLTEPGAN